MKDRYKNILKKILTHSCPTQIPRSGTKGENVNCYVVFYEPDDGTESTLIRSYEHSNLLGLGFNTESKEYDLSVSIPTNFLDAEAFRITHYIGLQSVEYTTLRSMWFGDVFKTPYISLWKARKLESRRSKQFNVRRLETKKHFELLDILLKERLLGNKKIDSLSLLTALHTRRWYGRPDSELLRIEMRNRLELLLDAGLLKSSVNDNFSYMLTGKVVETIEQHSDDERRHKGMFYIQILLSMLTLIMTAAALDQADVFSLKEIVENTTGKFSSIFHWIKDLAKNIIQWVYKLLFQN